jgi:hypothetical protein
MPAVRADPNPVDLRPARGVVTWLVLVYKVPASPSRMRATIWRRLKALGAVYLQHGVAALPRSAAAERALRSLCEEIRAFGGIAQLLHCHAIAGQTEVAATYNRAREHEYRELVCLCQDFAGRVERLIAERCVSYVELKKHDEWLTKLKRVLPGIQARDVLGAPGRDDAVNAVAQCEEILEVWSAFLYQAESL